MNNNAPAYKKTNVAVYLAGTADAPRYNIIDARQAKQKSVSMRAMSLSAEDAYQLYIGNDIEVEAIGSKGPYKVFIVNAGINEKAVEKNGKTYINRYLEFAIIHPVEKNGQLTGYRARHPEATTREDKRKVFSFANIGPKDNPIELEPGHIHRLLKGETVQIAGRGSVTFDKIIEEKKEKDGKTFVNYRAKLDITWADRQEVDMASIPDTDAPVHPDSDSSLEIDEEEAALAT